jgi:hypothetical protein
VFLSNTKTRRSKLTADKPQQLAALGLDWTGLGGRVAVWEAASGSVPDTQTVGVSRSPDPRQPEARALPADAEVTGASRNTSLTLGPSLA